MIVQCPNCERDVRVPTEIRSDPEEERDPVDCPYCGYELTIDYIRDQA